MSSKDKRFFKGKRFFEEYLGDGVHVFLTQTGGVIFTSDNGVEETDTVGLSPEVMGAFDRWRVQCSEVGEFDEGAVERQLTALLGAAERLISMSEMFPLGINEAEFQPLDALIEDFRRISEPPLFMEQEPE